MKLTLITLLLLFACAAHGQEDTIKYQKYPNAYGPQYKDIWATRVMRLPDTSNHPQHGVPGAIARNTAGTRLFMWDGTQWKGGSGGVSVDSVFITSIDSIFINSRDSIFIVSGSDTIYIGNASNGGDSIISFSRNNTNDSLVLLLDRTRFAVKEIRDTARLFSTRGIIISDDSVYKPNGNDRTIFLDTAYIGEIIQQVINNGGDTTIYFDSSNVTYYVDSIIDATFPSPPEGNKYLILNPTGGGGLSSHANQITTIIGGTFANFETPIRGKIVQVNDPPISWYKYDGTQWIFQRRVVSYGGDKINGVADIGNTAHNWLALLTNGQRRFNITPDGDIQHVKLGNAYKPRNFLYLIDSTGQEGIDTFAVLKVVDCDTCAESRIVNDTLFIKSGGGGGGGATAFTDLTDVPSSYSGASLKLVRVNTAATGLEFFTSPYLLYADTASMLSPYLRSNVAAATYLTKANNLSDLASTSTARTNLGLGTFALLNSLALSALSDVTITSPASNNIITYNSGTSKWVNVVNPSFIGADSGFIPYAKPSAGGFAYRNRLRYDTVANNLRVPPVVFDSSWVTSRIVNPTNSNLDGFQVAPVTTGGPARSANSWWWGNPSSPTGTMDFRGLTGLTLRNFSMSGNPSIMAMNNGSQFGEVFGSSPSYKNLIITTGSANATQTDISISASGSSINPFAGASDSAVGEMIRIKGVSGKIGFKMSRPVFDFDFNGTGRFMTGLVLNKPIIYGGNTPSTSAGTGAGTSPTISITGNDAAGYITITTGSSPTASGNIVTITFSTALTNTPTSIQLTPANEAAATESTKFYVDQSTASPTSWIIKNTSSGLTASTPYKFYYTVTQ